MKANSFLKALTALLMVVVTLFTCMPLTAVKSQAAKEYPELDYTCDQPLFEFNSPVQIFGDYDDSLGFKAKLTAYLTGTEISKSAMWKKVYYDLLYKAFNTNEDWHQFDETVDGVQEIEKWISSLALNIGELILDNDPNLKLVGFLDTAVRIFLDTAQDTIAVNLIEMKPLVYLAENASNDDIKAAAQELISYSFNETLCSFVDESCKQLLKKGYDITKKIVEDCTIGALKENSTEALKYLPRLLAWVNVTLAVKDIVFFTSGQGDVLDGYINLVADFYLRQELYSYHSYIKNQGTTAELANNFNSILFVTNDLYNNFRRMMGEDFDKLLDSDKEFYTSDELLAKEYELLNTVTVNNYYKRSFDIMKPGQNNAELLLYPEQKTHQLVIPGIRYGVKVKLSYTAENKCFTVDKKTGTVTLTGKEGKGKIRASFMQNGEEYTIDVPVVVKAVQPCTNLRNEKSTAASVKLSWDASENAHYYAVYQYIKGSWKLLAKDIKNTTAVVEKLNPGSDYRFAVLAYAVVKDKIYKSKSYPTIDTVTLPKNPENFRKTTVTDSSISVAWDAAKGATGYRIYSKNSSTGKWSTAVSSTASLSHTFRNLPQNKSYTLAVRAYYKSGKSVVWSESYPVITVKTAGIPDAPANLSALSDSNDSITLSWNKAKNASGYLVYRYDANAKKWIKLKTLTGTSVKISGLKSETVYRFAVRSYNNLGTKVFYSKTYPTITATAGLGTVTGLKSVARNESAIKLSWNKVKNATGYRVYKYNSSTGKWDTVATTAKTEVIISELTSGTVYKFAVRAYYKNGSNVMWARYYPVLDATTLPGQVKNFKGSLNGTAATFTWSKVSGADGYGIYSYNASTKKYTLVKTVTTNSATVENLSSDKTLYFVAVAYKKCNGTFIGAKSNVVTFAPLPTEKEVAYMYNQAYTVAYVWLGWRAEEDSSDYVTFDGWRYYRINHSAINTKAKLTTYLSNYFSSSLIDSATTLYKDFNGKLYLRQCGMGSEPEIIDLNTTTATFVSVDGNAYKYKINYSYKELDPYTDGYNTRNRSFNITIINQNGKWVINEGFRMAVWSAYIWDGKSPIN